MLFNLYFANNTILSCLVFFFLIIDLYFLIPAVTAQTFNPIAELVIPIGIPIKKVKTEIEIHTAIVEVKYKSVQYNLELCKPYLCFLLINLFYFSSSRKSFLVSSIFFNRNS